MGNLAKGLPPTLIRSLFGQELEPYWPAIISIALLGLLQTLAVLFGSLIDGTWILPGVGKGFFEHYGVWAILISDPILLISAGFSYLYFKLALETLPLADKSKVRRLHAVTKPYFEFVELRGNSVFVYALLVIVGLLAWVLNVVQTTNPVATYGNDVFDAVAYRWGFLANKFNLLVSWTVVYPAIGLMLVSMSVSTWLVLRRFEKDELLGPTVLHPDGCYGFGRLGTLNVALLWPYVIAFAVMFALRLTHEAIYPSLVVPIVVLAIVCLIVSFITIQPITAHTRRVRRRTYNSLAEESQHQNDRKQTDRLSFAVTRISYGLASGSPYSGSVKTLLNIMRFVPLAATVGRLMYELG
ncbi:hypothetical protein [Roseibium marinum]|uniref:Uncharacterized protein n=1 Tax=Roseibium marinum TaxID=281252 RepID=A0A2S3UQL1_9HYPH|nr:hypothetical protein [Roseibium marinum]POF29860.1 hypothetical protein CLV41_108286 [Roseibium marinum]